MNDQKLLEEIRRELAHMYWWAEGMHQQTRRDGERRHKRTVRIMLLCVILLVLGDAVLRTN